jgi:hypothetical protein
VINEKQLGGQAAPPRPRQSKQPTSAIERIIRRLFGNERELKTNLSLLSMSLPGVVLLFIFAYLPMLGIVIAFKDYRFNLGIFGSEWVGFQNFRFLFGTDAALRITRNTMLMNILFISTTTVCALAVAILMNEAYRSRMSKYYLKWAPKTGPRAKVYNGAEHQARGGAGQWSRNGDDTRQPTNSALRWKRLKAVRRLASYRANMRFMPT